MIYGSSKNGLEILFYKKCTETKWLIDGLRLLDKIEYNGKNGSTIFDSKKMNNTIA